MTSSASGTIPRIVSRNCCKVPRLGSSMAARYASTSALDISNDDCGSTRRAADRRPILGSYPSPDQRRGDLPMAGPVVVNPAAPARPGPRFGTAAESDVPTFLGIMQLLHSEP